MHRLAWFLLVTVSVNLNDILAQSVGGSLTIYGPRVFERSTGQPVTVVVTFTQSTTVAPPYIMHITNGAPDGNNRVSSATIKLNGQQLLTPANFNQQVGSLEITLDLLSHNTLEVRLASAPGSYLTININGVDITAPVIILYTPAPDLITSESQVIVSGRVEGPEGTTATINSTPLVLAADGSFSATIALTIEGPNNFTVAATSPSGSRGEVTRTVIRDTGPPTLTVNTPENGMITTQSLVTATGSVSDPNPVVVTANDSTLTLDSLGVFSGELNLVEGPNAITVTATDAAGNSTTETRTVIRDTTPPELTVTNPVHGSTTSDDVIQVTGYITDATPVLLRINSTPVDASSGTFSHFVPLTVGNNTILLHATDAAGNESSMTLNVVRTEPFPVDPSSSAPPLDSTLLTIPFSRTVEFLYTGQSAIQAEVEPGAIQGKCITVVRGRTITRTGQPLPGVTVKVFRHPELGYTLSRADGMYDLVVNGGHVVTLTFERAGFFAATRDVDTYCGEFVYADTVALVEPDQNVTTISFDQPMETARGSVVTDQDGTRQATLVFTQGTQATMVLEDDSVVPLSTINVRITEYSIGATGVNAMPAALPATSSYTYCANITADEALAAGAKAVNFDRPVMFYVDNFMGFPVGTKVPVGAFDFRRRTWTPHDDGRIIQIVGVIDGCALVAVDEAWAPSDSARLADFGITAGERCHLATLYASGQSIMRTPVDYFGIYDKNYGIIPIEGSQPPGHITVREDVYRQQYPGAGITPAIDFRNMTVSRTLSLTGMPFALHYDNDRNLGRNIELTIPISRESLPENLESIALEVIVAGRKTAATFPPQPNQNVNFFWDGKDVYGRFLPGTHEVRVRVGYSYPGRYQQPPYVRNFALTSGIEIPFIRARTNATIWKESSTEVRVLDNRTMGMGGWNLTAHHAFDTDKNILYMGTGRERAAVRLGGQVETIAGTGALADGPDNVPATQSALYPGADFAFGPDGSIYVSALHRVRRIGPDGIIRAFAGNGNSSGPLGDGGPALNATIVGPRGIAVGPDGSVYIIEANRLRIRKVDPNGIITTVAGSGLQGFAGDGGPATQAQLREPWAIAVDADNNVYFSDQNFGTHNQHFGRIRKVDPLGMITTVAGGGALYDLDDGIATQQGLDLIQSLSIGTDGSLYFSSRRDSTFAAPTIPQTFYAWPRTVVYRLAGDGRLHRVGGSRSQEESNEDGIAATDATFGLFTVNGVGSHLGFATVGAGGITAVAVSGKHIIRMIDENGIVNTYAGIVSTPGFNGDGRLALHTRFNRPEQLRFGPDGYLYVFDKGNNRLRRIRPHAPSAVGMTFTVPSPDGSQLFHFDVNGRHLKTTDAITGRTLFTFAYDSTGWLVTIMDRDSLVSQIERDHLGRPVAIISPYGVRTNVAVDGDGYLSIVQNPNGEATQLGYAEGGLLSTVTAPLGNGSSFMYDSTGRLLQTQIPGGGGGILTRFATPFGYQVNTSTALGRTVGTLTEFLPNGAQRLTNFDPRGRRTIATLMPDGTNSLRTPDGTLTVQRTSFDPRFGVQVPIPESTMVIMPSGLTFRRRQSRSISLVVGQEVKAMTDSAITNGKTTASIYNDVQKLNTVISPEGRRTLTFLNAKDQVIKDSIPGIVSTTYEYDALGRMVTMRQRGRVTRYSYDGAGRLLSTTDPLGRTDSMFYDDANRLVRQAFSDGSEVRYTYDANGNLVSIIPPGRPVHTFAYDVADRPEEYLPPVVPVDSLTPTRFEYNLDNQLTRTLFADSSSIDIEYDPIDGTPATISFDRGTIAFEFDSVSGNLSAVTGPDNIRLDYAYDGSLSVSETWSGDVSGTVEMKYDADFRVVQQKVNGTDSVDFRYDRDNNLVGAGALRLRRNTLNGLLERDTLGSVTGLMTYTPLGELSGMDVRFSGAALFTTSYVRDSLSRITQLTETIGGVTRTFRYDYDAAGRLWKVRLDGVLTAEYSYDANGNRIAVQRGAAVDSGRYDEQDRMLEYAGDRYAYTKSGYLRHRVHNGDTTSFTYDGYGNLVSVQSPTGNFIEYIVDPTNRRIGRKINDSFTSRYVYSGDLRPVAALDSAGNVVEHYVYATRVNVPDYIVKSGAAYRVVTDHLGSVRLVADVSNGGVVQRLDYDEFGHVILDTNPGFQPCGYAGGLYDPETGLVRFGSRDYDASTGRWTAKDPIGFEGSRYNLFAYSNQDPINQVDRTGRFAEAVLELIKDPRVRSVASAGASALAGYASEHMEAGVGRGLVNLLAAGLAFESAYSSLAWSTASYGLVFSNYFPRFYPTSYMGRNLVFFGIGTGTGVLMVRETIEGIEYFNRALEDLSWENVRRGFQH